MKSLQLVSNFKWPFLPHSSLLQLDTSNVAFFMINFNAEKNHLNWTVKSHLFYSSSMRLIYSIFIRSLKIWKLNFWIKFDMICKHWAPHRQIYNGEKCDILILKIQIVCFSRNKFMVKNMRCVMYIFTCTIVNSRGSTRIVHVRRMFHHWLFHNASFTCNEPHCIQSLWKRKCHIYSHMLGTFEQIFRLTFKSAQPHSTDIVNMATFGQYTGVSRQRLQFDYFTIQTYKSNWVNDTDNLRKIFFSSSEN